MKNGHGLPCLGIFWGWVCVWGWLYAVPLWGPLWLWHPPTQTVNSDSQGHQAVTTDLWSLVPFPSVSLLKQEGMKCDIFLLGSPGEQAIYEDLISITLFPMTGTGPPQSETTSYGLSLVSTWGRPAPRGLHAGPRLPDSSCCESTLCLHSQIRPFSGPELITAIIS